MSVFKAIYYRHHGKKTEDFETLQDALNFLEHGADYNELSAFAILWDGKITWVNDFYSMDIIELECKEFLS